MRLVYPVGERCVLYLTQNKRENDTIFLNRCSRVTIENVTIRRGPCMGIIAQQCSDITVKNVKIAPLPGRGDLITTTTDSMMFVDCSGRICINGCRFLITIIWLIMVPIAVYMVVTAVMGLIGADEMTVSNGIMDVVIAQALCYALIWLKFLTLIFVRTGGVKTGHITFWHIVIALFIAPLVCVYDWVRAIFFLIVRFFRWIFGKKGASSGSGEWAQARAGGAEDSRRDGSDAKPRRWIESALPRSTPRWHYGYVSIESMDAEISPFSNTVAVNCRLCFRYDGSAESIAANKTDIQNSMQSILNAFAAELCGAASDAFESFRSGHTGYDGEWYVKPGDIEARFEA